MPTYLRDSDFIAFTGQQESQFLCRPSEVADAALERLRGASAGAGAKLPWSKTHGYVAFRPEEVTLWAGVNGHGKSLLLSQAIAWWLREQTALLASLEMPLGAVMARMLRQVHGRLVLTEPEARQWLSWSDNRLWLYDQLDSVAAERIVGLVHYAAHVLKVDHVCVDGLTKCGIAPDDYGGQKAFIDGLAWAVKHTGTHCHLIAHLRKGQSEDERPDKWDVRGASEITDISDNLLLLWRNKPKERAKERHDMSKRDEPDAVLTVAKQRHGEWEGAINLYYHAGAMQYTGLEMGAMPWEYPKGDDE